MMLKRLQNSDLKHSYRLSLIQLINFKIYGITRIAVYIPGIIYKIMNPYVQLPPNNSNVFSVSSSMMELQKKIALTYL